MEEHFLQGRRLLKSEIPKKWRELVFKRKCHITTSPAILVNHNDATCQRCGSSLTQFIHQLYQKDKVLFYCPFCLNLGISREDHFLYSCSLKDDVSVINNNYSFNAKFQLTSFQQEVSTYLINSTHDVLVYAVTGAGKTEMFYQVVDNYLKRKKRVVITCPRVDVCLELYDRLKKVFCLPIGLFHGKNKGNYQKTQLVICTTHQLLRFYKAFDLMIVDEVDAFPYTGNPVLAYGVKQSLNNNGRTIYLSATPPKKLVNSGIKIITLSRRYHGNPLPVPQLIFCHNWQKILRNQQVPLVLRKQIKIQIEKKRRTLLFCPTINLLKQLEKLLKEMFPHVRIVAVHAKDNERYEKVNEMRNEAIQLLLTTTILERGLTFSDIDVLVMGSDHSVFNEASLVQIAGRVGRKADYPKGKVIFIHDGQTRAMKNCVKHIKKMNHLNNEVKSR